MNALDIMAEWLATPSLNLDEHLAFTRSLFDRADTDKDGVLTPDEVQSANERAGIR